MSRVRDKTFPSLTPKQASTHADTFILSSLFFTSFALMSTCSFCMSHQACNLSWPLTPAADKWGDSRRNWSTVRPWVITNVNTAARPPELMCTNTYTRRAFYSSCCLQGLSPRPGLICGTTRCVLPHSEAFSHSLRELTASILITAPRPRWPGHLNSAPTRWLMGVRWKRSATAGVSHERNASFLGGNIK